VPILRTSLDVTAHTQVPDQRSSSRPTWAIERAAGRQEASDDAFRHRRHPAACEYAPSQRMDRRRGSSA
jgi:hypothetical protein